jgi:hypothetical protein
MPMEAFVIQRTGTTNIKHWLINQELEPARGLNMYFLITLRKDPSEVESERKKSNAVPAVQLFFTFRSDLRK